MEPASKKTPTRESLVEIIRTAAEDLKEQNEKAFDFLVSLADDGSLGRHQTKKTFETIAGHLLSTIECGGRENAD